MAISLGECGTSLPLYVYVFFIFIFDVLSRALRFLPRVQLLSQAKSAPHSYFFLQPPCSRVMAEHTNSSSSGRFSPPLVCGDDRLQVY